jgi:hypothetical protein
MAPYVTRDPCVFRLASVLFETQTTANVQRDQFSFKIGARFHTCAAVMRNIKLQVRFSF